MSSERERRLEKLLQEAEQRVQDEQRARQEAEQRRQDEQRARQEAEQRRQEAEQRVQGTTLSEFLIACHSLSKSIKIETDPTLTTKGETTIPYNRKYPRRIIPWDKSKRQDLFIQEMEEGNISSAQRKEKDFSDLQEEIWKKFDEEPTFQSQQLFPSSHIFEYVKSNIEVISSEMGLRGYESETVENMVHSGLRQVYNNEVLRDIFQLRGNVTFDSHLNLGQEEASIDEAMQEMVINEHLHPVQVKGKAEDRARGKGKSNPRGGRRADQFCVHHLAGKTRIPVLAIEYKAPHKLSQDDIVTGLREIEPDRDVIDKEGHDFSFHSMRLITAVITQIFSYMIRIGLQYGYVCTGEAFIFLKITDDPSTVYYYLSIPNQDVEQTNEPQRTAVAQVLAFTLHALAAERPTQDWFDAADDLREWKVEYENVLRDIPPTVRKEHSPTPYKARRWKSLNQSWVTTRSGRQLGNNQRNDDDDDDPPTPCPSNRMEGGRGGRGRGGRGGGGRGRTGRGRGGSGRGGQKEKEERGKKNSGQVTSRQYCTQRCLHGLLTGGALDKNCPNVKHHCGKSKDPCKHAVNPSTFLRMMRDQLAGDRDTDCEPLYIQGARGALFKLTLTSHAYTVAAKGTISAFIPYLQHEAAVYEQLRPIQGTYVPVCLGAIDLVRLYHYNGVQISHMLLLGWGGTRIDCYINRDNKADVVAQAIVSLQAIHQLGVLHQDAMPRNMLWNTECNGVMLVDFERAARKKTMKKRVELETISSNQSKRKRNAETSLDGEKTWNEKDCTQFTTEVMRMEVALSHRRL